MGPAITTGPAPASGSCCRPAKRRECSPVSWISSSDGPEVRIGHADLEQALFVVDFLRFACNEPHRLAGNQPENTRAIAEQLQRLCVLGLMHDAAEALDAPHQHLLAHQLLGEVVVQRTRGQHGVERQVECGHRAVARLVDADFESVFRHAHAGCDALQIVRHDGCRHANQDRVYFAWLPARRVRGLGDEPGPDLELQLYVIFQRHAGQNVAVEETKIAHVQRPAFERVAENVFHDRWERRIVTAVAPRAVRAAHADGRIADRLNSQLHPGPDVDHLHGHTRSLIERRRLRLDNLIHSNLRPQIDSTISVTIITRYTLIGRVRSRAAASSFSHLSRCTPHNSSTAQGGDPPGFDSRFVCPLFVR